jgi:hypothetical protein
VSASSPAHQRNTDDLLSNLTPRTIVDAFQNPSGSLKACIDAATPAEQAFALRVAIASNTIYEWLEELSAWPWPTQGGSVGFEAPAQKRRGFSRSSDGFSEKEPLEEEEFYMGSLLARDVARYDRRIDEITQRLEDLDIEEIKTQVLHNHIMPLSRPGTPILSSSCSTVSSMSAMARMDDLTALITAATVQALPNLSKLTRLMSCWSFRLLVLRRIPVFLASIADAEAALQSGQTAIELGVRASPEPNNQNGSHSVASQTLSRADFEVMKSILERKVAKAGRDLDAMLDMLEGQPDTLPEEWIDRMDALEQAYGEWSVVCERKIRETDWARTTREAAIQADTTQAAINKTGSTTNAVNGLAHSGLPAFDGGETRPGSSPPDGSASQNRDAVTELSKPIIKLHLPAEAGNHANQGTVVDLTSPIGQSQARQRAGDIPRSSEYELPSVAVDGPHHEQAVPLKRHAVAVHDNQDSGLVATPLCPSDPESDLSDASDGYAYQPESPCLSRARRGSNVSESSTIIHEAQVSFTDSFSSDQFDQGTPERPRRGEMDVGASVKDELIIADSPTPFRSSTRSMSVSFNDKPTITELPSFDSAPSTPTKSPRLLEDDGPEEDQSSFFQMSALDTDDQLQQQISEILESVPAKIRLTSEPPAINLNPPDFKMPTAHKVPRSSDGNVVRRSQSNISMRSSNSRSCTPSFTLAPAYARSSRPRHHRGNQDIKLYHLSRSNGEAPIKLFIRCVGGHGERVMVRVGGGWADLGEYLKEYAAHHGRRSAVGGDGGKVEVKDVPRTGMGVGLGTPPSRPTSVMDSNSPDGGSGDSVSPLRMRKVRRPMPPPCPSVEDDSGAAGTSMRPKTPLSSAATANISQNNAIRPGRDSNTKTTTTPSPSNGSSSVRSRSSSRISWEEEDSYELGMAGPRAKHIEMSEESRAWVESVKEKVRLASGEHNKDSSTRPWPRPHSAFAGASAGAVPQRAISQEELTLDGARFGEIGRVGATKRVFRRGG